MRTNMRNGARVRDHKLLQLFQAVVHSCLRVALPYQQACACSKEHMERNSARSGLRMHTDTHRIKRNCPVVTP